MFTVNVYSYLFSLLAVYNIFRYLKNLENYIIYVKEE